MSIKKIFTVVIVILLMTSICAVDISAVGKPYFVGDANLDEKINVKDATTVQKYVAELEIPDELRKSTSEVDGDGKITVKDATMIQKKCAGFLISFPVMNLIFIDINIKSVNADYNSGMAMAGRPVTFTATSDGNGAPYKYQFLINGEEVTEFSEDNTYSCTFDETGFYEIKVNIINRYGVSAYGILSDYEVVEPFESETLMIKAFQHNQNFGGLYEGIGATEFFAEAMFGSGNYEYAFYMDGELVQDYSSDNTYGVDDFYEVRTHILTLYARDVQTGDVVSQDMTLDIGDMIIG